MSASAASFFGPSLSPVRSLNASTMLVEVAVAGREYTRGDRLAELLADRRQEAESLPEVRRLREIEQQVADARGVADRAMAEAKLALAEKERVRFGDVSKDLAARVRTADARFAEATVAEDAALLDVATLEPLLADAKAKATVALKAMAGDIYRELRQLLQQQLEGSTAVAIASVDVDAMLAVRAAMAEQERVRPEGVQHQLELAVLGRVK